MTLWNILAPCLVILYTYPYPYVINLLLWAPGRSVASQPSSMEGGTRFPLDTGHHCPDSLVTWCHAPAPWGVWRRRYHGADYSARAVDPDQRALSALRHASAARGEAMWEGAVLRAAAW